MPLEAQHLILDVVGANRAEVTGSQQRGLLWQAGDLILVADQQLQLVQSRAHPLGLACQTITVHANAPALFGTLGLAAKQQRQQLMAKTDAQQLVAALVALEQ